LEHEIIGEAIFVSPDLLIEPACWNSVSFWSASTMTFTPRINRMRCWILPTLTIALDSTIIPSGLPEKVAAKCDHLVNPPLMTSIVKFTDVGNSPCQWLLPKYFMKAKQTKSGTVSSRPSETTGSVQV